jgi:DNA-binding transcriptional LysR family regulator
MKLRQIEMLQAIVSTGSVTGAARLLNVSQPAVSRMLGHTEQQLGFPLFVRDGGRLKPTAETFALYGEVEGLMPRIAAVNRLAANLRAGQGRLRIVAVPSLAQTLLPEALAEFCRDRPALDIELRALHTRELVDALLLRDADVGFDFGGVDHPSIQRQALVTRALMAAAPAGQFPTDLPLTPDQVGNHLSIRMAGSDPLASQVAERARGAWATSPPRFVAQNYHAALALVSHGLGVALIDPYTAAGADRQRVNIHALDPPLPLRLDYCVATNRPVSAQATALARVVAKVA